MVTFAQGIAGAVFPLYGVFKSWSSIPANPMSTGVQTQVTNTNTNAPLSWAHAAQNVGQTWAKSQATAIVAAVAIVGAMYFVNKRI